MVEALLNESWLLPATVWHGDATVRRNDVAANVLLEHAGAAAAAPPPVFSLFMRKSSSRSWALSINKFGTPISWTTDTFWLEHHDDEACKPARPAESDSVSADCDTSRQIGQAA